MWGVSCASAFGALTALEQSTYHVATLHTGYLTNNSRAVLRIRFKTAIDSNIPFNSGRSIDPGDARSSGCFACGGARAQILACLYGSRNAAGQWARTDGGDGYTYTLSGTERARLGCSTN